MPSTLCTNKLKIERKLAFVTCLVPVKALSQSSHVVLSEVLDNALLYIFFPDMLEEGMHCGRSRPGALCVTQIALGLDGTRQMLRSRQPSAMLLIFLLQPKHYK